jgi:hypothetical protein
MRFIEIRPYNMSVTCDGRPDRTAQGVAKPSADPETALIEAAVRKGWGSADPASASKAGAGFALADEGEQFAHVGAVVHAGERLTQRQEQRAAFAPGCVLERIG